MAAAEACFSGDRVAAAMVSLPAPVIEAEE